MANVQKYTRANVQGLSIHWDRKTENHANKDIDNSRSHLNYDLCTKEGDSLSRLNERLKEVHCLNRKDVNHCACWIVTLPEALKGKTPEEQRLFFKKTYAFLTDRYGGEKNVITATVHNDETTPHMHFAFVPTMFDVKRGMDKVCAKKVVSRKDLSSFHGDLDHFLKAEIPHVYQGGILNDKTIGIDDVKSLKKHSEEIQQEKAKMTEEFEQSKGELVQEKERLEKEIEETIDELSEACDKVEALELQKELLEKKVDELKEKSTTIPNKIKVKAEKEKKKTSIFGKEQETGNLIITEKAYDHLNKKLSAAHRITEHYQELLVKDFVKENESLRERVNELEQENATLKTRNKTLVDTVKTLEQQLKNVKLAFQMEVRSAYRGFKEFLKENTSSESFESLFKQAIEKVSALCRKERSTYFENEKGHIEDFHKKEQQKQRSKSRSWDMER